MTEHRSARAVLQLELFLPYRLSLLANTVSDTMAALYRDRFDLSIPDWRVMAVLARFPGSSARTLVSRTRMDKVAISRSVTRLEQRGLLLKQVSQSDRRRSELCLSEAGQAVYAEIVPLARGFEKRLLDSLDARQRTQLDELLSTLQAAAEHLPGS